MFPDKVKKRKEKKLMFPKAALNNIGIPRVNVAAGASGDGQPEVDVSDAEFLQFDTSKVPVIVTLTKVTKFNNLFCPLANCKCFFALY